MEEKRQHPRKPVELSAAIKRASGELVAVRVVDLSFGGMYVETAGAFTFGDAVTVLLSLPEVGETEIPATVRWTKPSGVGVQFGAMGARATHALGDVLRD